MKRLGYDGMRKIVTDCLNLADYTIEALASEGISSWRNPHSITVVFPRPSEDVVRKWQIAPYGDIGHLITMPHVTRDMIDDFISDYLRVPPVRNERPSIAPPGARIGRSFKEQLE
jgi:histidine decarboxylase